MKDLSCFFFKQKTAYEMRISDWSSDVCSSDLCLVRCTPNWPPHSHRYVDKSQFSCATPRPNTTSSTQTKHRKKLKTSIRYSSAPSPTVTENSLLKCIRSKTRSLRRNGDIVQSESGSPLRCRSKTKLTSPTSSQPNKSSHHIAQNGRAND